MNEQLVYGFKQALIMGGLASLTYVVANQDQFFGNLDDTTKVVAFGVVALGVRVFEAWRDGVRADKGQMQDADVKPVIQYAKPITYHPYADNPDLQVNQELKSNQSLANADRLNDDFGDPFYN